MNTARPPCGRPRKITHFSKRMVNSWYRVGTVEILNASLKNEGDDQHCCVNYHQLASTALGILTIHLLQQQYILWLLLYFVNSCSPPSASGRLAFSLFVGDDAIKMPSSEFEFLWECGQSSSHHQNPKCQHDNYNHPLDTISTNQSLTPPIYRSVFSEAS